MLFALLGVFLFGSCTKDEETLKEVTSIKMSAESLNFIMGDIPQVLTATALPEKAEDRTIVWSSTDKLIACAVDGVVTAYKEGECNIIATAANGIEGICKITVTAAPVKVTDVLLERDNYKIEVSKEMTIEPTVYPKDAVNKELIITIEDETILSHEGSVFTALKEGTTKITFTSKENSEKVAIANIEVSPKMEFVDTRDGHAYKTVKIGNQIWFAENFAYITTNTLYPTAEKSSFSPYTYVYGYEGENVKEAKATDSYKKFGALYNRQAAYDLCPEGWHLPTVEEWQELELFIGMTQDQVEGMYNVGSMADKLKGLETWTDSSDAGADDVEKGNNETGFNALAGGTTCEFWTWKYGSCGQNIEGTFWSNTHNEAWTKYCTYSMRTAKKFIYRCYAPKEIGLSVRYIKDKEEK